jgi:hypothetical protein
MNYIDLIKAIEQRPKFFLKSLDIEELDAFLRGVSYANFLKGEEKDLFKEFRDEWIPSKFATDTNDWIEVVKQNQNDKSLLEYFFYLWNTFISELAI